MTWKAWRRVPEAGACDFCLMLASRGAVYKSQMTATGQRYHGHCRCTAKVESEFDRRTDVEISPEDADRVITFRTDRGYQYTYDLSKFPLRQPPKVPAVAKVDPRTQVRSWVEDKVEVRQALERLGVKAENLDDYLEDHYIMTNGIDVVEVARRASDGTNMSSWRKRVDVARYEVDYSQDQARALREMIAEREQRIDERLASYRAGGATPQQLAHYRKGHKVDGYADQEIVYQQERIREARERLASEERNAAAYQQVLDDFDAVTVVPITDKELSAVKYMADDLDDVLSRVPLWRRLDADGNPRSYVLTLDDVACKEAGAYGFTYLGSNRIWISSKVVLDRNPVSGEWVMRAGGVPHGRRTVAHEVGHTVDEMGRSAKHDLYDQWKSADGKEWKSVSEYGRSNADEMYAELFAEWMYGDRRNPAVAEFARVFKWAERTKGAK